MTHNNIYRLFTVAILVGALLLLSACGARYYSVKNDPANYTEDKAECERQAERVVSTGALITASLFFGIIGYGAPNPLEEKRQAALDNCMKKKGWSKCPAPIATHQPKGC